MLCDLEMYACQYCNHSGMMQMKPSMKLKYLMSKIFSLLSLLPFHISYSSPLTSSCSSLFPLPLLLSVFLLLPIFIPLPPYFPSFPSSSPSSSYFISCSSFSSSSYSPLPSSSFSSSSVLSMMKFPTGVLSSDIIYRGQSL